MTSLNLLSSRLLALVKYGQWEQNDVVDLFLALLKQSKDITNHELITRISKILYQIEIHKINKTDLTSADKFADNIEQKVNDIAENTRDKTLTDILEEIRKQGAVEKMILVDVEDIVSTVSSWCRSNPRVTDIPKPTAEQWKDKKIALFDLCKAVKKTTGWYPRETQMVSWCILVLSGSSQLVQVGTGEGKSCIVAMFAAYRAITRKSVDIISSSAVLAERDKKQWQTFYQNLNISVDVNTNKKQDEDLIKCYKSQVVYGTTQSFAGDWLRHKFHRDKVRAGRKCQCVIVDEVDSLMLDKGLEIVYLNSTMPTMKSLNVILAEIWFLVNKLTHLGSEEILIETIEKKIKATTLSGVQDKHQKTCIPGFLEHINGKLQTWIKNALLAKTMTLGHEYILHKDGVVPVDYGSTGVVQNNMKWGDGLQQFLEMKHQTRLTDMCIITNFKSNVSLFQSYTPHIYGVTGTLGNQEELDLLQKLYSGIKTCKIPSFRLRKLYEEEGMVIRDEEEWKETICEVVRNHVRPTVYRGPRAALIICETINRAQTIKEKLEMLNLKLKMYTNNNMDNSMVTDKEMKEGDIIIATNLAGRGTDLKVCAEVNKAGGLFVVQTFLPLNMRVENQAFGRTARQGHPGSAQLIMCFTHFSKSLKLLMVMQASPISMLLRHLDQLTSTFLIPEIIKEMFADAFKAYQENTTNQNCEAMAGTLRDYLKIQKQVGPTPLEVAKQARDTMIKIRLSGFLTEDIPKITKKEALFNDYLKILEPIIKQDVCDEDMLSSLHECWGMWLLMKFDEKEPLETLRQCFKEDMQSVIEKLQSKQCPSSMVYHYLRSGNRLRQQGKLAESIEMYTRAIEEDACWGACALYNRALSTLKRRDRGYIGQALADLRKADEAVELYIKQLDQTFTFVKNSSQDPNETETLFTKQFRMKHRVQDLLRLNIQEAIKKLQIADNRGGDVLVTEKHVLFLMQIPSVVTEVSLKNLIRELINLSSLGLDTIISLDTGFSVAGFLTNMLRSVK